MLDPYWKHHAATLARARAERTTTFAGLKVILDVFTTRSSGDAIFPGGSDDTLADALSEAGWSVKFEEGDYFWTAANLASGAVVQHVEGDLYCLLEGRTPERLTAPRGKKGRPQ